MKESAKFEYLGEGYARKGDRIYVRVSVEGRATWKSTGTNHLPDARKWREKWNKENWLQEMLGPGSHGLPISQKCTMTVNQLAEEYRRANHPTIRGRNLKAKSPRSILNEQYCLRPILYYFGSKRAGSLTLKDCDTYHEWRLNGGYRSEFQLRGHKVRKKTKGGDRSVDLELTVLANVLHLAVRRGHLASNPIRDRGHYADKATVRHCRDVAPDPEGLAQIVKNLEQADHLQYAELTQFLAFTGLRIGEALSVQWEKIDFKEALIHVKRSKRGVCPFVVVPPELARLLESKSASKTGPLLFHSPFDVNMPLDPSAYRRQLTRSTKACGLSHVTPHGLRSYYVTQARISGLTDAEIAYLIGDKTGPTLISQVYGDCRPEHALAVARKIQLTIKTRKN